MDKLTHFLNRKFVTEDELQISPRDLGFSRGYVVHDFIVTYNHKPFKLLEHIDRLFKSAELIGLQIPWSKEQCITWVNETLDKNDKDSEKSVRIFVTGGKSNSMYPTEEPTIMIMVNNRSPKPASQYENGVKAQTVKYKRPYPTVKNNIYIEGVMQLSKVKDKDIEEVIYYDESQVFEGSGTNVFAVINNKLVTTKTNIVEGITRNTLLEIVKLDIPVEVRDFTIDELQSATEIFITGSNSEVRGVVELDGKAVGDGKVGEVTREVLRQYREYIQTITRT
jgi:branched-chain amino acid aminotransferase